MSCGRMGTRGRVGRSSHADPAGAGGGPSRAVASGPLSTYYCTCYRWTAHRTDYISQVRLIPAGRVGRWRRALDWWLRPKFRLFSGERESRTTDVTRTLPIRFSEIPGAKKRRSRRIRCTTNPAGIGRVSPRWGIWGIVETRPVATGISLYRREAHDNSDTRTIVDLREALRTYGPPFSREEETVVPRKRVRTAFSLTVYIPLLGASR